MLIKFKIEMKEALTKISSPEFIKECFESLKATGQRQRTYLIGLTIYTLIMIGNLLYSSCGLLCNLLIAFLLMATSVFTIKMIILASPANLLSKIQHDFMFTMLLLVPSMLRTPQAQVYRCCLYIISIIFKKRPSQIVWIILEILHFFPM